MRTPPSKSPPATIIKEGKKLQKVGENSREKGLRKQEKTNNFNLVILKK